LPLGWDGRGFDLCEWTKETGISLEEIPVSFKKIHISLREICISSRDLHKRMGEIHISSGELANVASVSGARKRV